MRQIRNWLYFTCCPAIIVEQHYATVMSRTGAGRLPIKAMARRPSGDRSACGHLRPFHRDFEYPSGARIASMCRQIPGTANRVGEYHRHEGPIQRGRRDHGQRAWKSRGDAADAGDGAEHADHASIPRRQADQRAEAGRRALTAIGPRKPHGSGTA
jgi:hypothetical protein